MRKTTTILFALLASVCVALPQNSSRTSDSLISLLKTAHNDTGRVNILNSLADFYISSDRYDSASYFATKAKSLSTQLNYSAGSAASLRLLGISATCQGSYSKSLTYLFQALKIAESIKNNYMIGKVLNSIGSNYSFQKDYANALTYFFKSLSSYYNPVIYEDIARAYHLQDKDQLSIKFYRRALSARIPQIEKSYILNDLGDIYESTNLDTALNYYFGSLKIVEELKNEAGICDVTGSIGDLLIKKKKYKEAISYENKSISIAKKINNNYAIFQSEKSLSDIYEILGNTDMSLKYYKDYISGRDKMFNEENTRQSVRSEMDFNFEKQRAMARAEQDKKDAIAEVELKRQQTQRNGFIMGLCIVIAFSIFLFRAFRRNQKAKNIIAEQKKKLEHKTKEITDSISYAKNIQGAMLPSKEYLQNTFLDGFTIYRPKDIVSGDFYWAYREGDSTYFATADCTGHGVPGAMMSMLACSLLNEIVIERKIISPEQVLNTLRDEIIKALNPKGSTQERKDGLDISFCCIKDLTLRAACANNGIYIVRDGSIIEVESDRFPVGKHITDLPFTLRTIELKSGDVIYTMSDGFCDQFGEQTGKKLMKKRFKEWIIELSNLEMPFIKTELETRFENWLGKTEQIDDVTVFATKV